MKSILFKNNYTFDGINIDNIIELLEFIREVKEKYTLSRSNTEIYATGIWRKIPKKQLEQIKEKFEKEDLLFNVISHEQENDYFEKAMSGDYNNKRVMMVNMGGKTTELVIFSNNEVEKK